MRKDEKDACTVVGALAVAEVQTVTLSQQGEELSNTVLVLAFDDHQPRVDSWNVHYRITAELGGVGSNLQADPPMRTGPRVGSQCV